MFYFSCRTIFSSYRKTSRRVPWDIVRNREYGPCEISRSVRLFPQNIEIFVTFWNCNSLLLAAYAPGTLPRFIPGGKIEYCDFLQKIIKIRLNPSSIRSQFTQIFINELSDEQKLTIMCKSYLTELTDQSFLLRT